MLNKNKYLLFLSILSCLWEIINITLFVKSAGTATMKEKISVFFPFNYNDNPGLWAYDITEFSCYTLAVLLALNHLYTHRNTTQRTEACFYIAAFLYCNFVWAFLAFSCYHAVGLLLFSIIRAAAIVMISAAFFGSVWDTIAKKRK